jgi:hypothetical protein
MTFDEMLNEASKVQCEVKREKKAGYLEIVVSQDNLGSLSSVLESYFGAPLKPKGKAPSPDAVSYATKFGGIRNNQTMYARKNEGHSEVAFFWPWENGKSITVKIAQE